VPVLGATLRPVLDTRALRVDGEALHPGAPLLARVARDATAARFVACRVFKDDALEPARVERYAIEAGQTRPLEVPYPWDELVPGLYRVEVALLGAGPQGDQPELESVDVGAYAIRRFRFSA